MSDDLIQRLRKRAEIRRQISTRKSVQEGKADRIADVLEEAAKCIEDRITIYDEDVAEFWKRIKGLEAQCAEQERRAEKAEAQVRQHYRSFDGHVYVKNENYSALVERAERAEKEAETLREVKEAMAEWQEDKLHLKHAENVRDAALTALARANAKLETLEREMYLNIVHPLENKVEEANLLLNQVVSERKRTVGEFAGKARLTRGDPELPDVMANEYDRGYEEAIDHIASLCKSREGLTMYMEAYRAAFTDLLVFLAAYRERKGPSTSTIGGGIEG